MTAQPVALVTGASRGIGRATTLAFARHGYRVFAGVRDPDKLEEPLRDVVALDVDRDDSVRAAVAHVLGLTDRIDVVVNNAARGHSGAVEDLEDADLHRIFETNVHGVVRVIRATLPHMRARRTGTIVNVSSISGRIASPMGGAYSATKFALEGLTEALWYETINLGVRVVLLEPGGVATSFGARAETRPPAADSPYRVFWGEGTPETPATTPEQVAATILRAVESPLRRLRWVVGDDAEEGVDLRRRLSDEELGEAYGFLPRREPS